MKKTVILIIGFMLVSTSSSDADWIDDWMEQKTVGDAMYLETQKRGYGAFGTFSARWDRGTDYLVSASPPQFKAGCGGIDMFLGSMDFMRFEYLVDKFENIIGSAAEAFAFDIAMSVLSEKVSATMKSIMGIVDRLNQLQLDDCRAGKALYATVRDSVNKGEADTQAISEYAQESGATDLWQSIKEAGQGESANTVAQSSGFGQSDMVSGCPRELRDIFFTDGYILEHLGEKRGYHHAYIELVRGLIGDIMISGTQHNKLGRCPGNNPAKILDALMKGDVEVRNRLTDECEPTNDIVIDGQSHANLREWVFRTLDSVSRKYLNKANMTDGEIEFLQIIPSPIFKAITVEIVVDGEDGAPARAAAKYADYIAVLYAYQILGDIYNMIDITISAAESVRKAKHGTDSGSGQSACKIELADAAMIELGNMADDIVPFMQSVYESYQAKLTELNNNINFANAILKRDDQFRAELAKRFGAAAVPHLLR